MITDIYQWWSSISESVELDDDEDESGTVTVIDDVNFTNDSDNNRESVTPSIPPSITHSEEEVPLSPSDTSNDERSATPRTDNSLSSTPPSSKNTTEIS